MKKMAVMLSALLIFPAMAEVLLNRSFTGGETLNLSGSKPGFVRSAMLDDGMRALEIEVPERSEKMSNCVQIAVPGEKIRGRTVVLTAEIRTALGDPVRKWGGAEFVLHGEPEKGKRWFWKHVYVGSGKRGWKTYRLETEVPPWIVRGYVRIGIVNAGGKVWFRNVKLVAGDTLLALDSAANMGFADEIAGDRKGGWHDQGSGMDAAKFPIRRKLFANVPFRIIDPKQNGGRSIVVFECPRLPSGPKSVTLPLPVPAEGKFLYLLHCSAWGQAEGTPVGTVVLTGTNGASVSLPILYKRDLTDWFGAKPVSNAVVGTKIMAGGGFGAAYVSRFRIPEGFGALTKVELHKTSGANAMWMLIGATVSGRDYPVPEMKKLEITENAVWKPLPESVVPAVKAGTALDFSPLFHNGKIGEYGRVVCGKNGHFEFEKRPGVPVRFYSFSVNREFGRYFTGAVEMTDHKSVDAYVDQIYRAGYNLVRLWAGFTRESKCRSLKAFEHDPQLLDLLDYMVFRLREKGIYINLTVHDPTIGFDRIAPWDPVLYGKFRYNAFLNKRDFDAWKRNTEFLLTRINPYTKTRLADDPQLAVVDTCNEMDTRNTRADDSYAPAFREFLKRKYSSFSALQTAWGSDASGFKAFEDVKTFVPVGKGTPGPRSRDSAEFITELETGFYRNAREFIRSLGYQGPVTGYLSQVSMRHAGVRQKQDFVSKNGYHDHPMDGMKRSTQASSIGDAANALRGFLSTRLYGKPFLVSEHAHSYWNRWRYEQGFVLGGFAALNEFDGLTAYCMAVTNSPLRKIVDFEVRFDPVRRACERMLALIFRRGDVCPSGITTRIRMDYEEVIRSNAAAESVNASQLRMGLLGKCFVDLTRTPVGENEVVTMRSGASAVNTQRMFTGIVDSPDASFDMDSTVKALKTRGLVPRSNRTDAENERFESSTGELFMECAKKRMTITTERFQGLCSPSGGSAVFPEFEVRSMNRNGCIALASVDGLRPLREARRMLLFIVTNALNSGTVFEEEDQRVRLKFGDAPVLLETGRFTVAMKTPYAGAMKAYALGLDGSRLAELPLRRISGGAELTVDTAAIPGGPSVFFELVK